MIKFSHPLMKSSDNKEEYNHALTYGTLVDASMEAEILQERTWLHNL